MKKILTLGTMLLVAMGFQAIAFAQGTGGGNQPGMGNDPQSYFFKNVSFTATASNTVKNLQDMELSTLEINYAVSGGNLRNEIDSAKAKSAMHTPQFVAHMKAIGMDRFVMIFRSDKNMEYLIYPGIKSYAEMPILKGQSLKEIPQPKMVKTEIGKETVAGHSCVKSKFVFTTQDGKTTNGIVWEATDLNNFPVQYQENTDEGSVTTLFKDIKLGKPDASLFEPPADYTRYNSHQELMQKAVQPWQK